LRVVVLRRRRASAVIAATRTMEMARDHAMTQL
jgi:hypothetical protein